jgi:hypothetical protein
MAETVTVDGPTVAKRDPQGERARDAGAELF